MDNFIYENITKIIFGKDTEESVGIEISSSLYKKVLLHYGQRKHQKNRTLR